jgi:hypothetical protein
VVTGGDSEERAGAATFTTRGGTRRTRAPSATTNGLATLADGTQRASAPAHPERNHAMPNPVENVVAKVVGKSAALKARLSGLKGVFTTLAEQHHEVGSLLSRLTHTDDYTARANLWREIKKELVSHEQGELLEIYPLLSGYDSVRDLVATHANDAAELEACIQEVDATAVHSEEWQPAVRRLIDKVTEHVELEEMDLFPKAQRAIGDDAAARLEEPFERAKAMAAARLG